MLFKTIYADPPWPFDDLLDPTRRKPYQTMTLEAIENLSVSSLVEQNAHLYLWTPNVFLKEALEVMEAWDFVYRLPLIWVKTTETGKVFFGLGHYFRNSTELLLFGVRGKMRTLTRNTRNVVFAKREEPHSKKPEIFYKLIEANSPEPRLELFARQKRRGWKAWGNEIDSDIIL